jgi:cell division protein DivIC
MFAICLVLILLIGMVTVSSITLKAKEESYRAQEIELEQQIEDEKARAEEIEDLEDYVGTDEYVEEIAKEKLGLVYDDEIVFRAQ